MVDDPEARKTFARIKELHLEPVKGNFDTAHLKEVHRRIFQDLPDHRPGEFRPEAKGHFKQRPLASERHHMIIQYAQREEIDRQLGPYLDSLKGGKAFANLDTFQMSEKMAQTYARLDYLHPFTEGNSRTLRTFTEQLARENGHKLDWHTTNVDDKTRTALYIARDVAVMRVKWPEEDIKNILKHFEDRNLAVAADQIKRFEKHDPLQEIIRKSLELGQTKDAFARTMTKDQAAREIAGLSPIAIGQAERIFDKAVVGDGRGQRGPQEKIDEANKMRAWATGDGARETMTKRLDQVRGDRITIHHEPGAPAFKRLVAISAGITRELDRQRSAQPQPRQPAPDRAAPPPDRSRNDDRER